MKKLRYLGIASVIALLSFSFVSCGDDEPGGGDGDRTENGSGNGSDDDDDDGLLTWSMDCTQMKSMGDYTFTYGYGIRHNMQIAPNPLWCTSISYKGKKILEIDYQNSKLRFLGYEGKGTCTSDFNITYGDYITKVSGTETVSGSGHDYVRKASWVFNENVGTGKDRIQSVEYRENVTYSDGLETYKIIKEKYEYSDGKLITKHIDVTDNDGIFDLTESWICNYEYDNPSFPGTFQIPMAYTAGVYSALQGTMRILALTGMFGYYGDQLPSQMTGHYEFTNRNPDNFPDGYTALDNRSFEENWGFRYDDFKWNSKEYDEGMGGPFNIFHSESDYESYTDTQSTYAYKFETHHVTGKDGLK